MMTQGTLVDATIIEAPALPRTMSSNAIRRSSRPRKGNQWHFGMKAHIGVDTRVTLTHSTVTTAANEHDLNQPGNLLHGESNLSQPMPATRTPQREGWPRWMWTGDRRASRQGKT